MKRSEKYRPRHQAEAVQESRDPEETAALFFPTGTEDYEQFRELMAHLQQVFWIGDSADSVIRYVSPAYETVWGRTCRSLIEDAETFTGAIVPEDRDRVESACAEKRSTRGYDEEFRILRPDGEMRWIRARSYPVRDHGGAVSRFAGIAEDITEQKAAERERSRLAAIIEYSDGVVVSITPDGIIVGWNEGAERLYGYLAEEIVGCSLSVLFPPGRDREYLEIMEKIQGGERVPSYETVRQRKDGTSVNVCIGLVPIEAREGALPGASEVGRDIERIKSLEMQVVEAQKMEVVGKLATGVAHDFNNILSVIMSCAEVLLEELSGAGPTRSYAEEIMSAVDRAVGLTRQLLVFSRKQPVNPVAINLNTVVCETADLLRRLIGEHITLAIATAEEPVTINGDTGLIGQLLMNLAVNARDAMPDGGALTIALKRVTVSEAGTEPAPAVPPGDYALLSIADSGVGMTDEVRAQIFEPFFTTKPDGTGLGLATCWTIVQQSDAFVRVASELGRGTTFDVYFPRLDQVADAPDRYLEARTPLRGTELILVVEDESAVRKVACRVLGSLGYQVLQAVNGQDGLRVAREHQGSPIQLVLTDVTMPQMSGRVMAEWLKASYPNMRILFASGYANDAFDLDNALGSDVDFLAKPYSIADLSAKVRGLLDRPS